MGVFCFFDNNHQKRRLPAIADRAVWENVTKRANWNKVACRSRQNMEGPWRKPRRDNVHAKVLRIQHRSALKDGGKEEANVKKDGE